MGGTWIFVAVWRCYDLLELCVRPAILPATWNFLCARQYFLELYGRARVPGTFCVWGGTYLSLIEKGSQNRLRRSNRRSRWSHSKSFPPSFAGESRSCRRR